AGGFAPDPSRSPAGEASAFVAPVLWRGSITNRVRPVEPLPAATHLLRDDTPISRSVWYPPTTAIPAGGLVDEWIGRRVETRPERPRGYGLQPFLRRCRSAADLPALGPGECRERHQRDGAERHLGATRTDQWSVRLLG